MSPIIALVSPDRRPRLARSLRTEAEELFCDSAAELQMMAAEHGAALVLTELRDTSGESTKPMIARLHRRLPDLPIIVLGSSRELTNEEILELGTLGATAILEYGTTGFGEELQAAIAKAKEHGPATAMSRTAQPLIPEDVREFFAICAHAGASRAPTDSTIRSAGLAPRTVRDRLRRAGLPPPQRIITWSRLLHALWRLELSGKPVKAVAAELGYGGEVALRNQLKRYTGRTMGEVRAAGGFRFVLALFKDELRSAPQRLGRPPPP
jgi:AraC-like DNA-binding protein